MVVAVIVEPSQLYRVALSPAYSEGGLWCENKDFPLRFKLHKLCDTFVVSLGSCGKGFGKLRVLVIIFHGKLCGRLLGLNIALWSGQHNDILSQPAFIACIYGIESDIPPSIYFLRLSLSQGKAEEAHRLL